MTTVDSRGSETIDTVVDRFSAYPWCVDVVVDKKWSTEIQVCIDFAKNKSEGRTELLMEGIDLQAISEEKRALSRP